MQLYFTFLQHSISTLFRLCRICLPRPIHHGDDGPDVCPRTKDLFRIIFQSFRLHCRSCKISHFIIVHLFIFLDKMVQLFCSLLFCFKKIFHLQNMTQIFSLSHESRPVFLKFAGRTWCPWPVHLDCQFSGLFDSSEFSK